jgi:coenzyme Q-binding protein COQ10
MRPFIQAVASAEIPLFKSLVTTWRFQPASSASPHPTADLTSTLHEPAAAENGPTLLTFDLEYAFTNPLHAHVSAAFFGQISKMMIRAFEERCLEVYGPGIQ